MHKFSLAVAALMLSAVSLPGAVLAQTTPTPDFATVDADKSGEVSFAELQLVLPNVQEEAFKTADADQSGGLSETEYATIAGSGGGTLTQSAPSDKDSMSNSGGSTTSK
jgi:hypothetical protein